MTTGKRDQVAIGLVGSALCGIISRVIVHPLDTVRARMMTEKGHTGGQVTKAIGKIVRTEGLRGLFRGSIATAVMTGPATAVYLTSYDWARKRLEKENVIRLGANNPLIHLAAGLYAEALSGVLWTPMEVVKHKLQAERMPRFSGRTRHVLYSVYKDTGVSGFFRGYFVNFAVFGPSTVVYWMLYERCKLLARRHYSGDRGKLPFRVYVGLSAFSSSIAAAVSTPFDVVKTRMQSQYTTNKGAYVNTSHAIREMYHKEGVVSFFKGVRARIMWSAPSTTLSVSLYEQLKHLLGTSV